MSTVTKLANNQSMLFTDYGELRELVVATTRNVAKTSEDIAGISQQVAELSQHVSALSQQVSDLAQIQRDHMAEWEKDKAELRESIQACTDNLNALIRVVDDLVRRNGRQQ